MLRSSRALRLATGVLSLALISAACGSSDDGSAGPTGADDGGGGASGSIFISGSSTVEPVSIRVAELLEDVNSDVLVDVEGPGTGDGFKKFCAGESDISDASRPIKDSEIDDCAANGVDFIELAIGYDGIAVMTNPANDAVDCLSFADLYALMGPESEDVSSWSDATALASELGSSTTFPDASFDIGAPGAESGTYDSFIELALEGTHGTRVEEGAITAESPLIRKFPGQADDNIILQTIEGSDSSFGWVGFAYAANAGDQVKPISISEEPGGECITPTPATIADGTYPISRTLYLYVNAAEADSNPAVAAFVDFYLGDGYRAVEQVGYVAYDQLASTQARWESRTLGAS